MAATEETTDRRTLARLQAVVQTLSAQNADLKRLVSIYDRLTGMVLQDAPLEAITRLFAELVGRPVTVLDPLLQPLASAGAAEGATAGLPWTAADPQVQRVLATLADERRPLRIPPVPGWGSGQGCVIAPIVVGEALMGYLAVLEPPGDESAEVDLLAVQHAATVHALALMRERIAQDVGDRLKEDLVDSLLLGQVADPEQARARALLVGYDPARAYRVLSVALDERPGGPAPGDSAALSRHRHVLDTASRLVALQAAAAIAVARRDELVVLAPEPDPTHPAALPATELGKSIVEALQSRFPAIAITVGIGGPCHDPGGLAQSYIQARRAVAIARRFGRLGTATAFEELGIYRLLFQIADPAELRAYAEQVLGPLVAYDRKHQTELVHTLTVYLHHLGSVQLVARELFVHVNTVSYRLQRIQTITGLDLENADDRLAAQVALKILQGLDPP